MEKTIELEIPLLLPNVKDEQDECLNRLEVSLQNQRGILRAHLEREKTPAPANSASRNPPPRAHR